MAEPRRSGRATKGQHTKKLDTSVAPPKSKKATKAEDTDGDDNGEVIRCVCGATAEDDDDERMMICCDQCGVWQHNECMGLTDDEDSVPENYWCEQCKPENHTELLAAMARGETPWEDRRKAREEAEAERKRKKKGKPKKPKVEEPARKEESKDVEMDNAPTNGKHEKEEEKESAKEDSTKPKRTSVSGKRKLRGDVDDSPDWAEEEAVSLVTTSALTMQEPSKKVRKLTSPLKEDFPKPPKTPTTKAPKAKLPERKSSKGEPIQTDKVEKLEDLLNPTRRSVASLYIKSFVEYVSQAAKDKTITVKSVSDSGAQYGLGLEHALYMELSSQSAEPTADYRAQARSILLNLKQNPELRQKILGGEVSVENLASMDTEEMASEEQQKANEQMKKEAEKQVVLVSDDEGPRIRRTHKGDELVDAAEHRNESIFTTAVPRAPSEDPEQNGGGDSTDSDESEHEIEEVELPETFHKTHTRSPSITAAPLRIDTEAPRPERKSSNFNIEDIWSSVKSADPDKQRILSGPLAQSPPIHQTPTIPRLHDPEVDQLLKDEDMDSPPYSPPGLDNDEMERQVWHGTVLMNKIAEFSANASHFGGVDVSSRMPWSQMLSSNAVIDGRIDIERANDYLCESHYSSSTDVVVLRILPSNNHTSQAEYDRLFNYFRAKNRYGVIGKSHILPVKDIYVLPVERGDEPLPAILDVLPGLGEGLQAPRTERFLLLISVVKLSGSAPPRSASVSIAPPVPSADQTPARDMFTPSMYQPSPSPAAHFSFSALPPHIAAAPTLKHLLEQAPNIGPAEMKLVQEILEGDILARTDVGRLTTLLVERQRQTFG